MPEFHLAYFEGDPCARKFLEGAFGHVGCTWDPIDDPQDVSLDDHDVILLSDIPARRLGARTLERVHDAVQQGTGLVMTGGWNSYGRGGYAGTLVAEALPVQLEDGDDRRHNVQGMVPRLRAKHPVVDGLDLQRPAVSCGHTRWRVKEGATVVLEALALRIDGGAVRMEPDGDLLVVGTHGKGRTVAYASDLAPHWSGGLTDWGTKMLEAPEGEQLGDQYVRFVGNLLGWAAR